MELAGLAQTFLQLATHAPSGKPKFLTTAIRRSVVVGYMGLKGIRYGLYNYLPVATLVGTITLCVALSRGVLETRGLSSDQIGRIPGLILQILYALGLFAAMTPVWRRLRLIV